MALRPIIGISGPSTLANLFGHELLLDLKPSPFLPPRLFRWFLSLAMTQPDWAKAEVCKYSRGQRESESYVDEGK